MDNLKVFVIAFIAMMGCGKTEDLETAQKTIERELTSNYIYERGNLPENPPPTQVKGYYDRIGGAYRYIVNEFGTGGPGDPRQGRDGSPVVRKGDRISFYFVAKIFSGSFDRSEVFYTNVASEIPSGNQSFDTAQPWSTDPLEITLGDRQVLEAIEKSLEGCRADDGNPLNNTNGEVIESDQVRIYLTSDVGFGNKAVYNVPGKSSLVYEITQIRIL